MVHYANKDELNVVYKKVGATLTEAKEASVTISNDSTSFASSVDELGSNTVENIGERSAAIKQKLIELSDYISKLSDSCTNMRTCLKTLYKTVYDTDKDAYRILKSAHKEINSKTIDDIKVTVTSTGEVKENKTTSKSKSSDSTITKDTATSTSKSTSKSTAKDTSKGTSNNTSKTTTSTAGSIIGTQGTTGKYTYVTTFGAGYYPATVGNTTINGVSSDADRDAYEKYLYNLCEQTGMDYPLLLAMFFYENGGYVTDRGNGQGCFGFTGGGSNCSSYSSANYTVSDSTVTAARDSALKTTFGDSASNITSKSYGTVYYGAAYAIEVLKSKISERGNAYSALSSYCGSSDSAAKRIALANRIRADLGWEQVDYKTLMS